MHRVHSRFLRHLGACASRVRTADVSQRAVLPVYRVMSNDGDSTRYYLDPTTGSLLQRADANRRWHRWLFAAVHRLDFAAWVRVRPAWDIILIGLMLGGIAVSATGVYLALRRVRSDLVMVFRALAAGLRHRRDVQGDPVTTEP
jgi:uncharacterized iron-regulated membrane protein